MRVRVLQKCQTLVLKSVAWDEKCIENDTKEILFGTNDGQIHLYSIRLAQRTATGGSGASRNPEFELLEDI
jgi:hypothetical protein